MNACAAGISPPVMHRYCRMVALTVSLDYKLANIEVNYAAKLECKTIVQLFLNHLPGFLDYRCAV